MKKALLSLFVLVLHFAASAQAPVINQDVSDISSCSPQAEATFINFVVSNATSYVWQVSTDGGNTWSPTTDGAVYRGSSSSTLFITTSVTMEHYEYHCIVSNASGSVTSHNGTLYIATSAPTSAPTIEPVSEVCAGTVVTFHLSGRDPADTIDWVSSGKMSGDRFISDSIQAMFPTSGSNFMAIETVSNGCGSLQFGFPWSTTSTLTVNPLQNTLAATSGETSAVEVLALVAGSNE
jgi:hypothetical protein